MADLDAFTEGDARIGSHAEACRSGVCMMACRCWCHGITTHLSGAPRIDADADCVGTA